MNLDRPPHRINLVPMNPNYANVNFLISIEIRCGMFRLKNIPDTLNTF